MSKLPSIITLATIAALLAGCSNAASEPSAESASPSAAESESATPSAEPTAEATAEETSPAEPEESAEPSAEPSPEPASEPAAEAPAEPAPTLEPLPAGPNDPFVPPPHGEPNPLAPVTPGIPGVPHSSREYFDWVKVTPVQGDVETAPTATIRQGETLAVMGDGYAPGQSVYVMLGWPYTDYNYIEEPATAVADQNGYFIYPIVIGTNVPPRDYVVMTKPRGADGRFDESQKRYHNLIITAAE
ncbi:hypothetical protein [Arthrobacter subterraneus]|uniref:hypothetical protein n=1 Tax=Arthrobacter subterraneus TaxID=335973 RepID=UPI000B82041A|nr:hypothetical protein [Arthrobacter subterraneus]